MEAGLACPDWPLCYGSLLPGRQMNIQVFLEWFHRLDAFLVGIALVVQFIVALFFKSALPKWLLWFYGLLLFLVCVQGGLGAFTVVQLLPSTIVTTHLAVALALVSLMSALSQSLIQIKHSPPPSWWRPMGFISLLLVIVQSLIGGRMATTWTSKKCLIQGSDCVLLDLHKLFAMPVSAFVLLFVLTAFVTGGWPRQQWPFLIAITFLIFMQISLGIASVHFSLAQPILTVSHQLIGALLVSFLAALSFRRPKPLDQIGFDLTDKNLLEVCHG